MMIKNSKGNIHMEKKTVIIIFLFVAHLFETRDLQIS